MIHLQLFTPADVPPLIAEVPDARLLMQWAGPQYVFPLSADQLTDTIANTLGHQPECRMFKAVHSMTMETLGHIQLINIDYHFSRCVLGRVLIFEAYRGNGFGRAMVAAAVHEAFGNLGMNEIMLSVFDFNRSALKLYEHIGFRRYRFEEGSRQFENQPWNLIKMKLLKSTEIEI